jgi:hypothetical protein
MIEFPYPELTYTSFVLRPEGFWSRPRLGVPGARGRRVDPDSLPTRIQLGGPLATPLLVSDVKDNPDLVTFMRDEEASWQLVHSGVTFQTGPGDRELETGDVRLHLRGADAVAWSLLPELASTPIQTTESFTFAPRLKLAAVEASLGEIEKSKTQQGQTPYLRADGLLSSDPVWRFKRTDMVTLDGTYRLVMVVRASVGVTARLGVTLGGSVRPPFLFRAVRKAVQLRPAQGPTIELRFPQGVD